MVEENKDKETVQESKPNDKEYNFRALEARFKEEREARLQAEKRAQEAIEKSHKPINDDDDDNYDEPYIDQKYFNKKLSAFEKNLEKKYEKIAEEKAKSLLHNHTQETWLKQNSDFQEVMKHAEAFAETNPELAETILQMPNTFERQKLVYRNIKAMGLHKAKEDSKIQEKINQNQRSPYYQPSTVGTSPYASQGDYSNAGKKQAYDKMQELKSRLRL